MAIAFRVGRSHVGTADHLGLGGTAGGPWTIPVGQATATNTAQAIRAQHAGTLGQASATNVAQPIIRASAQYRTVGQASSSNIAQPVTRVGGAGVGGTSITETLAWVEPDGTETSWPVELLRGLEGRGAPPVSHRLEDLPNRPGSVLWATRHQSRRIVVPIYFAGADTAVRAALRTWAYKLDATRGIGKIRVYTLDGLVREIPAVYAGGMELVEDNAWSQLAAVEFVCPDPYWSDIGDASASATTTTTTTTWFPFFPLRFVENSANLTVTATNAGDVPVWPRITLTGPMGSATIVNATTGQALTLSQGLAAGQSAVLDARQDYRTVTGPSGENWYPYFGGTWWQLVKGPNVINITAGGTGLASGVALSWRAKWLTV